MGKEKDAYASRVQCFSRYILIALRKKLKQSYSDYLLAAHVKNIPVKITER